MMATSIKSFTFIALASIVGICGCAGQVTIEEQVAHPPVFQKINARVGTYATAEARNAVATHLLFRIEIGRVSEDRFEQAFESMFYEVKKLDDWPPWRHAKVSDIDAILELDKVNTNLQIGDDAGFKPDSIEISYTVCMYRINGEPVGCWETSASRYHQRKPFECMQLSDCLTPMIDAAIRDGVAQFMVEFERDDAVNNWADDVVQTN